MPTAVSKPGSSSHPTDITDAVKDTVHVRPQPDTPRNRPGRSHTAVSSPSNSSRPIIRRSHSQDSGGVAKQARSRSGKKGSQHADVIDRLDFTGVGAMFHHDGPFDACAPSRNRQRNMAPIHAWSLSPAHDLDLAYGDGAYPGAHAYSAFSNDYPEPPKKKVDAIAEAWGIHEPEPFEEFLAGGGRGDTPSSSIYNGRDSHGRTSRRTKDGRDAKEVYKQYLDEATNPTRPRVATRRTVPPPQPIFVPDPVDMHNDGLISPGTPKRSKSLMQRIRKMRDTPNVPAGSDSLPSSPMSPTDVSRPTHRSQNSFLGRFGGGSKPNTSNPPGPDKLEPYVYIDAYNKQLPATPGPSNPESALDAAPALTYSDSNGPSGSGLGRKTSIMQKVGRVVRGR
ncbi:hypothetical protein AX15_001759 [Amanita polypyramis BW_CC]|nr:hypothetical protein AX15_001759 [Amanita polypyramis BW_CC]